VADAAFEIAASGKTSDPLMIDVLKARRINRLLGTAIAPWEINMIPEDNMDAIFALDKIGEVQKHYQEVENEFAKWRKENGRK
jgi:hypothetical protein